MQLLYQATQLILGRFYFIKFVSLCNTITTHNTHTHNIQYNKLAQITKDLNLYIK